MAVPQCSGVQLKWSLKVNLTQIQYFWRACPWLVGISRLLHSVVTWVGCTAVKMLRPIQWCKKLLVEMTKMGDAVSLECRTEWWAVSYLSATIKLPLTLWKTLDSAEILGCFLLFLGFFVWGIFVLFLFFWREETVNYRANLLYWEYIKKVLWIVTELCMKAVIFFPLSACKGEWLYLPLIRERFVCSVSLVS